MNKRLRVLCVGLLLAVVSQLFGNAPASASGEAGVLAKNKRVTVEGDGSWIRHNFSEPLPGGTRTIIDGDRIVGPNLLMGCKYSGVETEPSNGGAITQVTVSREVAHNESDCRLMMETATLTLDQARKLNVLLDPIGVQATASFGDDTQSMNTSSNASQQGSTTKGRYQKLYYEDPPQIDVTSVTARVRWTYTGTCTTSSRHSASWGWFSLSGWSRTAHWWGHDRSCSYGATTSNTGTYRNGTFCAGVDTWNRYYVNYVQGKSNGDVRYEWSARKWGGCTRLLSFHRVTGHWGG